MNKKLVFAGEFFYIQKKKQAGGQPA